MPLGSAPTSPTDGGLVWLVVLVVAGAFFAIRRLRRGGVKP
jgi:MYXO-CTERM domain-containing protein